MERRYEEIYHTFLLPFEATLFTPTLNQDELTTQTNELLKLVDRLLTSTNRSVSKLNFLSVAAEEILEAVQTYDAEFSALVLGQWTAGECPASEAVGQVPRHCFCLWVDCLTCLLGLEAQDAVKLLVDVTKRRGLEYELRTSVTDTLKSLLSSTEPAASSLPIQVIEACITAWHKERSYRRLITLRILDMARHALVPPLPEAPEKVNKEVLAKAVKIATTFCDKGLVTSLCRSLMITMESLKEYQRTKETLASRTSIYERTLTRIGYHLRGVQIGTDLVPCLSLAVCKRLLDENERWIAADVTDCTAALLNLTQLFHIEKIDDFRALIALCPSPFSVKSVNLQSSEPIHGISAEDLDLHVEQLTFEQDYRVIQHESTPVLTVALACALQSQLTKLHVVNGSEEIKLGLREAPLPVGDGVLSGGLIKIINSESLPGQSLNWLVKLGNADMDLGEWSRQISEEAILDRLRVAVLFSINPTGSFELALLRAISKLFKLNRPEDFRERVTHQSALQLIDSLVRRLPEEADAYLSYVECICDSLPSAGSTASDDTYRPRSSGGLEEARWSRYGSFTDRLPMESGRRQTVADRDHFTVIALAHSVSTLYAFGSLETRRRASAMLLTGNSPLARLSASTFDDLQANFLASPQPTSAVCAFLLRSGEAPQLAIAHFDLLLRIASLGAAASDVVDVGALALPDSPPLSLSAEQIVAMSLAVLALDVHSLSEKLGFADALNSEDGRGLQTSARWVSSLTSLFIGALSAVSSPAVLPHITDPSALLAVLINRLPHCRIALWLINAVYKEALNFETGERSNLAHQLAEARSQLLLSILVAFRTVVRAVETRGGTSDIELQLLRFIETHVLTWLNADRPLTTSCWKLVAVVFDIARQVVSVMPVQSDMDLEEPTFLPLPQTDRLSAAAYVGSRLLCDVSLWLQCLLSFTITALHQAQPRFPGAVYDTHSEKITSPLAYGALESLTKAIYEVVVREKTLMSLERVMPETSPLISSGGALHDVAHCVMPGLAPLTEKLCRRQLTFLWLSSSATPEERRHRTEDTLVTARDAVSSAGDATLLSLMILHMAANPSAKLTLEYMLPVLCAAIVNQPHSVTRVLQRDDAVLEALQQATSLWIASEELQSGTTPANTSCKGRFGDMVDANSVQSDLNYVIEKSGLSFGRSRAFFASTHSTWHAPQSLKLDAQWRQLGVESIVPHHLQGTIELIDPPARDFFVSFPMRHVQTTDETFLAFRPQHKECNHSTRSHLEMTNSFPIDPCSVNLRPLVGPRRRLLELFLNTFIYLRDFVSCRGAEINPVELLLGLCPASRTLRELHLRHPCTEASESELQAGVGTAVLGAMQRIGCVDVASLVMDRTSDDVWVTGCLMPFADEAILACEVLELALRHTPSSHQIHFPLRDITLVLSRDRKNDSGEPLLRYSLGGVPRTALPILMQWYVAQARLLRSEMRSNIEQMGTDIHCGTCAATKSESDLSFAPSATARRKATQLVKLARTIISASGENGQLTFLKQALSMAQNFAAQRENLELGRLAADLQEHFLLVFHDALLLSCLPVSPSGLQSDASLLLTFKERHNEPLQKAVQAYLYTLRGGCSKALSCSDTYSHLQALCFIIGIYSSRLQRIIKCLKSGEQCGGLLIDRRELMTTLLILMDIRSLHKILHDPIAAELTTREKSDPEILSRLRNLSKCLPTFADELYLLIIQVDRLCIHSDLATVSNMPLPTDREDLLDSLDTHNFRIPNPLQGMMMEDLSRIAENRVTLISFGAVTQWAESIISELSLSAQSFQEWDEGLHPGCREECARWECGDVRRSRLSVCVSLLLSLVDVPASLRGQPGGDLWQSVIKSGIRHLVAIFGSVSVILEKMRTKDHGFLQGQLETLEIAFLLIRAGGVQIFPSVAALLKRHHEYSIFYTSKWQDVAADKRLAASDLSLRIAESIFESVGLILPPAGSRGRKALTLASVLTDQNGESFAPLADLLSNDSWFQAVELGAFRVISDSASSSDSLQTRQDALLCMSRMALVLFRLRAVDNRESTKNQGRWTETFDRLSVLLKVASQIRAHARTVLQTANTQTTATETSTQIFTQQNRQTLDLIDRLAMLPQITILRALNLETNDVFAMDSLLRQNRLPFLIEVLLNTSTWTSEILEDLLSEVELGETSEDTVVLSGLTMTMLVEALAEKANLRGVPSMSYSRRNTMSAFLPADQRQSLISQMMQCLYLSRGLQKAVEGLTTRFSLETAGVLGRLSITLEDFLALVEQ